MKMDIESFQEQLMKDYTDALKRQLKAIEWFFENYSDKLVELNDRKLIADQGRKGEFAEDAHFWSLGSK